MGLDYCRVVPRASNGAESCGGIVVSWAEVPGVEGTRSWEMLVTVEVNRCRELCVVGMTTLGEPSRVGLRCQEVL
ncbi:hypothetical protein [Anaplasma marginale]|uniref:hypothetical protein n=1 Tax=Anaplasma marginale TaxID=770 RepID=UPI00140382E7|nr:hypothetical protein [Anaplasma marginale]